MKEHWNLTMLDVLSRIASELTKTGHRLELGVTITGDSLDTYVLKRDTVTLHKDCLTGTCWLSLQEISIPYEKITGLDGIFVDIDCDEYGTPMADFIPVLEYRKCSSKPMKFNMLRPKYKEIKL